MDFTSSQTTMPNKLEELNHNYQEERVKEVIIQLQFCTIDVFISIFFNILLGNHALSKYSDILTCVETRLSMLSMTYLKYMQNGSACFIPGKVIEDLK